VGEQRIFERKMGKVAKVDEHKLQREFERDQRHHNSYNIPDKFSSCFLLIEEIKSTYGPL